MAFRIILLLLTTFMGCRGCHIREAPPSPSSAAEASLDRLRLGMSCGEVADVLESRCLAAPDAVVYFEDPAVMRLSYDVRFSPGPIQGLAGVTAGGRFVWPRAQRGADEVWSGSLLVAPMSDGEDVTIEVDSLPPRAPMSDRTLMIVGLDRRRGHQVRVLANGDEVFREEYRFDQAVVCLDVTASGWRLSQMSDPTSESCFVGPSPM